MTSKNTKQTKKQKTKNAKSSTLESQALTSVQIYKGKCKPCKNVTHTTQSYLTSGAGSTSNAKVYKGFYNSFSKEMSQKLSLPTATDSLGLLLNSSNLFFGSIPQDSWFTIKNIPLQNPITPESKRLWRTSLPSTPSSLPDYKDGDPQKTEEKEEHTRRIKKLLKKQEDGKPLKRPELVSLNLLNAKAFPLRLYFNSEQHDTLKQWMGVCRLVYNHVVSEYNRTKKKPGIQVIRDWWKEQEEEKPYIGECPYNLKDGALKEALAAIEGGLSRQDQGKKAGKFSFRLKKDAKQILTVQPANIQKKTWFLYSSILFPSKKEGKKQDYSKYLPKIRKNTNAVMTFDGGKQLSTSVLVYHKRLRQYTLNVNYTYELDANALVRENQAGLEKHVVSLDPGVKTFNSCYSPTMNMVCKVASYDYERLVRLANAYAKVQGIASKLKGKERKHRKAHLVRAQAKIFKKIQCLKREVHYKLASWLTTLFDIIIVPPFNQQNCMARKKKTWTHKETRKNILTWAHCRFRNVLTYLAKQRGKEVVIQNEAYTTKTCSGCGWINEKVGNKDVFRCLNTECEVTCMDRDTNGARNILLRALTEGKVEMFDSTRLIPFTGNDGGIV